MSGNEVCQADFRKARNGFPSFVPVDQRPAATWLPSLNLRTGDDDLQRELGWYTDAGTPGVAPAYYDQDEFEIIRHDMAACEDLGCNGISVGHASARTIAPNPLTYMNTQVSDYGNVYVAGEEELRRMVEILSADV